MGPAFDSYTERRVQSRNSNLRFTSSKVSAPVMKKLVTAKDSPHSTQNMGDEKEHMMQSKSFTLLKSPKQSACESTLKKSQFQPTPLKSKFK